MSENNPMDVAASPDELSREIGELRASRARVVAAADDERRRIERALHDGVQQDLVALAVNLQLARQLADSDPDALEKRLEEIAQDVRDALETVRDLAAGVYPPLLLDRGLADALRSAARSAAVRTRVEATADRYRADVEAAVYFSCVHALATVDSAGGAAQVTMRVWPENASLLFEVVVENGRLGALTGADDRLGAVGGTLRVFSESGGARLLGTIPLER